MGGPKLVGSFFGKQAIALPCVYDDKNVDDNDVDSNDNDNANRLNENMKKDDIVVIDENKPEVESVIIPQAETSSFVMEDDVISVDESVVSQVSEGLKCPRSLPGGTQSLLEPARGPPGPSPFATSC